MATLTLAMANAKRLALRAKIAARHKTAEPVQKDVAEAKAETVSPDTVDKSIAVPTVSLCEAGEGKYARLKQVAAEEPEAASEGLEQVGNAFGELADAVQNLRENLDLAPVGEGAPLKERIASYRKFAHSFVRLAEENPQALEQAITEVYQGMDEVATALENYAENMGLQLEPKESPVKQDVLEETVLEEPVVEEKLEEEPVGEKEAAGADGVAFTSDRDHSGKPEVKAAAKDYTNTHDWSEAQGRCLKCDATDVKKPCPAQGKKAADAGSEGFVTDRDEKGQPKTPTRLDVPRLARRAAYIIKVAQEAAARHKKAGHQEDEDAFEQALADAGVDKSEPPSGHYGEPCENCGGSGVCKGCSGHCPNCKGTGKIGTKTADENYGKMCKGCGKTLAKGAQCPNCS